MYRCFVAILAGVVVSGCRSEGELGASTQAARVPALGANGGVVYYCSHPIPPGPIDLDAAIKEAEIDRPYKSARPGFLREWVQAGGQPDGTLLGEMVFEMDNAANARAMERWLDNDFILDGVKFWDRPGFSAGHQCQLFEIVARVDRPSNVTNQVMQRMERFQLQGADARQRLQALWQSTKVEALRRGHSSIYLLHSEADQMAALMYFEELPLQQRSLMNPIPIAARPPYVDRAVSDTSTWMVSIWFPFAVADSGRPALWPLPGLEPWNGDGICVPSRHESVQTSVDCLATCGNGMADPGETPHNCPADAPL